MANTDQKPPKYADWHKTGLRLLLSGQKPTAQGLIDGRGGGSMTTATAALNEFYADYLPSVLSAATLGAPAEIAELVGDLWTRLAGYARDAATKNFEKERGELQAQVKQLQGDLFKAGSEHTRLTAELKSEQDQRRAATTRAESADAALLTAQKDAASALGALRESQRLIQTMQARVDAEIESLRSEHATALSALESRYQAESRLLQQWLNDARSGARP